MDYMGLTWYSDVGKDDDDLLNASVEVDVSAIVLQLVHLKQSKSQKHLQNQLITRCFSRNKNIIKIIVHPVVDVDPMVLVGKVCLELVSRLFIRYFQLP